MITERDLIKKRIDLLKGNVTATKIKIVIQCVLGLLLVWTIIMPFILTGFILWNGYDLNRFQKEIFELECQLSRLD